MKNFAIEPYGFRLHFTVSRKEMKNAYAAEYESGDNDFEDCAGCMWHSGYDYYIGVFDTGVACLDTLAHECQHLLLDLCVHITYDPSKQQEPLAFLAGWLQRTLLFAHPKFKEAMNEPAGVRARDGGRRSSEGDGAHQQQRGSGESAQQPVCTGSVPEVCNSAQ